MLSLQWHNFEALHAMSNTPSVCCRGGDLFTWRPMEAPRTVECCLFWLACHRRGLKYSDVLVAGAVGVFDARPPSSPAGMERAPFGPLGRVIRVLLSVRVICAGMLVL